MIRPEPAYFLLVDDLEENLVALDALLRRDGLVLLKARSGSQALEMLLTHDVALALVDVQMPEMDGFELAELMRGTERTRRVPIIFLTAGTTDRQRRFRGYEAGAVDFLQKPIETDVLKSKAEVFFELFRQRQEVAIQRDELRAAKDRIERLLTETRQHAEALKEADRRKDEFLAMLAHELRNPLAPVQNAIEVLRMTGADGATVTESRDIIARQVSHMSRLIDDLLDVARIARGKIQIRSEPCDLVEIVKHTADDYRSTLEMAGITLQVRILDQPLTVAGDRTRLAQVVGNLLHNAKKFTPRDGSVTVEVQADWTANAAVVTVRDTGSGMDEKILSCLFEPFSQADQSLDRDKGGLGLGLALVKGLIELHHGNVSAASAGRRQGSTFILRLPLLGPVSTADDVNSKPASQPGTTRMRILIVEDNRDAAESLRMLLSLLGHDAKIEFDARGGISAAQAAIPDMVISDLGLPGDLTGYDLAKSLRAIPDFERVFLVALSGYGQDEDRRKAEDAGFDRYLVKPVLLESLRDVLSAAHARRTGM